MPITDSMTELKIRLDGLYEKLEEVRGFL